MIHPLPRRFEVFANMDLVANTLYEKILYKLNSYIDLLNYIPIILTTNLSSNMKLSNLSFHSSLVLIKKYKFRNHTKYHFLHGF